jgi:hypothetical protein
MLSTELEYLCTELECFLGSWNAFDSVGIPLYTVGMLSTGLERFRQFWNTFVQCGNAFYSVGMLSTELEYLCTELELFLHGCYDFD